MQTINRRKALATVAAIPAAVALSAVPAQSGPSELAALIRRYFEQVDAFNRTAILDGRTDEDNDALAAATYEATQKMMIGLPARTRNDALAAFDLLIKEAQDSALDFDDASHLHGSLIRAIRGYLEGRLA